MEETNKRRKLSHEASNEAVPQTINQLEHQHTKSPTEKHTHTIILLHPSTSTVFEFGHQFFCAQGNDGRTLPQIFPSFKWVLPSTIRKPQGHEQSTTSAITPARSADIDLQQLRACVQEVVEIVRNEVREVLCPERVILGGVGHGCAVAIHALMSGGIKLGGFVGLNGTLPLKKEICRIAISAPRAVLLQQIRELVEEKPGGQGGLSDLSDTSALDTPVLLGHALGDKVVPVDQRRRLCTTLLDLGFTVDGREHEGGGHGVSEPQGVDDVVSFLLSITEKKEVRFAVEVENIPEMIPGNPSVIPGISHLMDVSPVRS